MGTPVALADWVSLRLEDRRYERRDYKNSKGCAKGLKGSG